MRKHLKHLRNEKGLTLVELLAVIVILAIIAVVAFVMIGKVIDNSKKDAHVANALQMIESTKLYEAQGGDVSVDVTLGKLQEEGMIDKVYNSWTKEEVENTQNSKVVVAGEGNERTYTVTLNAGEGSKCNINGVEQSKLSEEGREACTE